MPKYRSGRSKFRSKNRDRSTKSGQYRPTPTPQSGEAASKHLSDLPGFYYDEEQKRYFKILPNNMSSVGSFVTQETIRQNKAEQQRLNDVVNMSDKLPKVSPSFLLLKQRGRGHLVNLLKSMQCGQLTAKNLKSQVRHHHISQLQQNSDSIKACTANTDEIQVLLENIQKMNVSSCRDKLLCMWSVRENISQCIQMMSVKPYINNTKVDRRDKRTILSINPTGIRIGPLCSKITSMCWAHVGEEKPKHVLYTTSCPMGYFKSYVSLKPLYEESQERNKLKADFDLGVKNVWSCGWNHLNNRLSVGSTGSCQVIDVVRRHMWTYNTYSSDPLAQMFSPTDPHKMYNGTKKGLILMHDLRMPGDKCKPILEWKQGRSVGHLKLLQDEKYIMASDISGMICMWDTRNKKVITRYEGLCSNYLQLAFYLDEDESILSSTGSDSYTKLWDVRTGEVLDTIPPPCPAIPQGCPVAVYSNSWGNLGGNRGLLLVMKDRFWMYT